MATRLYLRQVAADTPPSVGEKSAALPVGDFKGNSETPTLASLKTVKGVGQQGYQLGSSPQTAHQDNYLARFTSPALAAQDITAQTWTLAVAISEANANANSYTICSVYVWRPSTQAVVGYIYDSDTPLGVEWGTTEDGQVLTFSGAAVTTQADDVLVLEFWRHAVQAMSNAYVQTVWFDGTTDVTDATTSDAASYIETPQTLQWPAITIDASAKGVAQAKPAVAAPPAGQAQSSKVAVTSKPSLAVTYVLNPGVKGGARSQVSLGWAAVLSRSSPSAAFSKPSQAGVLTLVRPAQAVTQALPSLGLVQILSARARASAAARPSLLAALTLERDAEALALSRPGLTVAYVLNRWC